MTTLIIGLVLFLGVHSVSIFAPAWRNAMAAKSPLGWKAVYGVLSLVGIYLVSRGYAEARLVSPVLYVAPVGLRHLVALLMLPAFILFLAPYFPGRIQSLVSHPQLIAVKLWAFTHLLVNGSVADLVLFGSFLAWAVVDRISLKKREQRALPGMPASKVNDVILVIVGAAFYLVFAFWAHAALIGVSPVPGM